MTRSQPGLQVGDMVEVDKSQGSPRFHEIGRTRGVIFSIGEDRDGVPLAFVYWRDFGKGTPTRPWHLKYLKKIS